MGGTELPALATRTSFFHDFITETISGGVPLDFAHFANGAGLTSEMSLVNLASRPTQPAFYFYDREGHLIAPDSVVDVMGDLEVTEDGALTVRTGMEPLGQLTIATHGRGELLTGSVKVVSDGPITGMLRFNLPHVGQALVGPSRAMSNVIFPVQRQEGGINTGVAIHNLESSPELVGCDLMSAGTVLEEVEIPLVANGQTSWTIDQVFADTDTSDFVGSVRCAAVGTGRFTAVALEMDSGTRIFTTVPVGQVNQGWPKATTVNFAHFANGESITSELAFVNLEARPSGPPPALFHQGIPPVRPVIYFYDPKGKRIAPESAVDVMGVLEVTEDGALTVKTEMKPLGELTIVTHGRGNLLTGSVKVVSDGPITGMLRFNLPHVGQALAGPSRAMSNVIFPVQRQEGGINTGVAIHNLESSPELVGCDLMSAGTVLEEVEIPLVANGQTSWTIDQVFADTDTSDFVGSVRCAAVGTGRFTAVALEMDSGTRIFTTVPVVPVPERTAGE